MSGSWRTGCGGVVDSHGCGVDGSDDGHGATVDGSGGGAAVSHVLGYRSTHLVLHNMSLNLLPEWSS